MQETILKSIRDIRDEAANVAEALLGFKALMPIITLMAKVEGTPSEVYPAIFSFCLRFNAWLNQQPTKLQLQQSLKEFMQNIQYEIAHGTR